MSFVVVIVILIIVILFLLVFSFGFFMGLSRKKKDLKHIEKEQELQKKTQESIISYFLKNEDQHQHEDDSAIFPVKIINRGYRRIKKFLKFKKLYLSLKETDTIKYLRKYILSYVGLAILILGIGFFIKYSINSAYINIAGRFVIAITVSILLILFAHSVSKKYKTFSSILMGGAVGIMFLTFTISYYTYGIFSDLQVFSVYFILTVFSVVLSLFYNRFELLFLAVTIGFAAPLFTGLYSNTFFLMLYLILLNIGSIFISVKFKNFLIRLVPSLFTGIYLILIVRYAFQHNMYASFQTDFIMLNIVYFVLIILAVAYHIKHIEEYKLIELMMVVIINLIYYSVGMYMLKVLNPGYKGVFTALAAVYNLVFLIIIILIKKSTDEQLIYFFGIVSLLFLTLIPPVELVGKSITMIWAVETVLLMWVSVKLDIKMLKFISAFLMLGLIASFVFDVVDNFFAISFNAPKRRLLVNRSFVSGVMTSAGLALNVIISGKSKDVYLIKPIKMSWLRIFISIVSIGALYISLYTEILYKITLSVRNENLINIYLGIYNFVFLLVTSVVILFIKNKFIKSFSGIIGIFTFIIFFAYYLYEIIIVRDHLLSNPSVSIDKFNSHVYMIFTVLFIFYFSYLNVKNLNRRMSQISKWLLTFFIVAVLTSEIDHLAVIRSFGTGIPVGTVIAETHIYSYSLFWMIVAAIISLSAMLFKDRSLIRISMFFILVVIIKSFIFDLSKLTVGQQIVTFTVLGFVILFTAFVRQRLFEKI
ncbi:MAG: DUF2339 domain-containing protein [Chlorobi bacterium]|nr:DUF2339 domain-containing protein [Chlorobiota bacterium]